MPNKSFRMKKKLTRKLLLIDTSQETVLERTGRIKAPWSFVSPRRKQDKDDNH